MWCWWAASARGRGIVPGRSTRSLEVTDIVPWLTPSKRKHIRMAIAMYGAWAFAWVAYGAVGAGEAQIGAHLALTLTGIPLSFMSWYLPHASMPAIVVAAGLGLLQWALVTAWLSGTPPVVLASRKEAKSDL
jgi:hypothetical protein